METKLGKKDWEGGRTSLATELSPLEFRARLLVEREQKFSPGMASEF